MKKKEGRVDMTEGGNQEMWREILSGPEIEWIPGTNRFNDTYCHQSSIRIGNQAWTKRAQWGRGHRGRMEKRKPMQSARNTLSLSGAFLSQTDFKFGIAQGRRRRRASG